MLCIAVKYQDINEINISESEEESLALIRLQLKAQRTMGTIQSCSHLDFIISLFVLTWIDNLPLILHYLTDVSASVKLQRERESEREIQWVSGRSQETFRLLCHFIFSQRNTNCTSILLWLSWSKLVKSCGDVHSQSLKWKGKHVIN